MSTIYDRPEHGRLREQVARFVAREVEPHALAWDEAGCTPREVLRKMGALGWLGLRYPARVRRRRRRHVDQRSCSQEALARSTFGGFVITVLVHTDMASPHLVHAGTPAQLERWLPRITRGELHHRGGGHRAGRRLGRRRRSARARTPSSDGDHYVLDGSKMFITNGVHADLVFVAARTGTHRRRQGLARHLDLRRRAAARRAFASGARSRRRLARVGHRRAGVRRLPRAGSQPARRGERRLLRRDEELPGRAHRAGRDGRGPLPDRPRADACST